MGIRYKEINVRLTGKDGNAFFVIGCVTTALRRAGVDEGDISIFREQAMSGDYSNVLSTCMEWVSVS